MPLERVRDDGDSDQRPKTIRSARERAMWQGDIKRTRLQEEAAGGLDTGQARTDGRTDRYNRLIQLDTPRGLCTCTR